MTKLLPPMEADPFYWRNAEEQHLAFIKSHGFESIEDWQKSQSKKSKLLPPDW